VDAGFLEDGHESLLGREHGAEAPPVQSNRRYGVSRKTLKGEDGAFEIEVPRDRDGSFSPRLVAKGQTRIDGLDDKNEPCGRHRSETQGERDARPRYERP